MIPSLILLSEVKDKPVVRKDLPALLRIGDTLLLRFTLTRRNGRRTEELRVDGEYRVTSVAMDARHHPRQNLTVEALKVTPSWRSIKSTSPTTPLPPARAPRTVVE